MSSIWTVNERVAVGKQGVLRWQCISDLALHARGKTLMQVRLGAKGDPAANSVFDHSDYGFEDTRRW
jgi:hypothetical protein